MNYGGIIKASLSDGAGWRVVLFVSGCEHHCPGCHNRESWDPNYGIAFDEAALNRVVAELSRDEIRGLTVSGGDPLLPSNRPYVERLLKTVKTLFPEKDVWLYTGYDWDDVESLALMDYVDFCVDGKFDESLRDTTLAFRGSSNQRIVDVKKSRKQSNVVTIECD